VDRGWLPDVATVIIIPSIAGYTGAGRASTGRETVKWTKATSSVSSASERVSSLNAVQSCTVSAVFFGTPMATSTA